MHAEFRFLSSFAIQISTKGILYDFVSHEHKRLLILFVIILCYTFIITEIRIVFYAMSNFRMMFESHYAIESNCMKRWIIIQSKWFPSTSTKLAAIGNDGNNLVVCWTANLLMVKIAHFHCHNNIVARQNFICLPSTADLLSSRRYECQIIASPLKYKEI